MYKYEYCEHHHCIEAMNVIKKYRQELEKAENKLVNLGYDKCDICGLWTNKPMSNLRCRGKYCQLYIGHIECYQYCHNCRCHFCLNCFPIAECNKNTECFMCHTNKCTHCFELEKCKYLKLEDKNCMYNFLICYKLLYPNAPRLPKLILHLIFQKYLTATQILRQNLAHCPEL